MESVNKKIFWYFFGFICIFYLLGSMFPNVDYNKYEYDYEYAYDDTISDLSDRVDAVELKLNNQIEDTKQNIKDREEREALEKSQYKEKNYQEETKKVDLEAYYNAIQNAINQVNTEVGYNSLEMEKTYETPGIRITLSEDNA